MQNRDKGQQADQQKGQQGQPTGPADKYGNPYGTKYNHVGEPDPNGTYDVDGNTIVAQQDQERKGVFQNDAQQERKPVADSDDD